MRELAATALIVLADNGYHGADLDLTIFLTSRRWARVNFGERPPLWRG